MLDFNGDTILLRRINSQLFIYQDDLDLAIKKHKVWLKKYIELIESVIN